jgi:D-glycero-alpha-D-manno-heptose-7-phosphate kinase
MHYNLLVRSRVPLRISFAGGGTDVPPYCDERGGAVLNATINRYAYATLRETEDDRFTVKSIDYDASISYGIEDSFIYDGQLDLAKGVLDHFRKQNGFSNGLSVYLHNDAPPGSGLGSSSAITTALIVALAEYQHRPMDSYQIAELAYRIERLDVGIKGGKQDQYAGVFGGFNFIEFNNKITVVNPLRLRQDLLCELEYSLIFAYIGGQHFSGHILDRQIGNYEKRLGNTVNALDGLKALAYEMKNALLRGELLRFGELLDESWQNKKEMAEGISTPWIDQIYAAVKQVGVLGGKITGAGGGGFMFFYCEPEKRFVVQEKLKEMGAQLVTFSFTTEGAQAWTIKL